MDLKAINNELHQNSQGITPPTLFNIRFRKLLLLKCLHLDTRIFSFVRDQHGIISTTITYKGARLLISPTE